MKNSESSFTSENKFLRQLVSLVGASFLLSAGFFKNADDTLLEFNINHWFLTLCDKLDIELFL